jgi:adenine-specific DNA-methyltransferase
VKETPQEVVQVKGELAVLAADGDDDTEEVPRDDLVVVAQFGEPIYPGLRRLGSVDRGGDKPAHVVIKGENYHALEALRFSHAGKIDCIYIDPPYNNRSKDWKYNNDYVDKDDAFRHSKWLAFMNRRLNLARELLRQRDSFFIVTIDENEYLHLGMLLRQVFPESRIQMVSIVNNPKGTGRSNEFSRVDEFAFFVMIGDAAVPSIRTVGQAKEVRWKYLRRTDVESERGTKKGGPRQFYPIYVNPDTGRIVRFGEPLKPEEPLESAPEVPGAVAVFPIREDGRHMNWGLTAPSLKKALEAGFVRVTLGNEQQPFTIAYLSVPNQKKALAGMYEIDGERPDGSKIVVNPLGKASRPTTAWRDKAHEAGPHGTSLLGEMIPGRKFPFPKSLYAVEDCLRLAVQDKPRATVLDFFGGSGTTAHAVARLNRQDRGVRQSILVTNNEVSADEGKALREQGHMPGDPEWEELGIFEHITRPRITAAITGKTPDGAPIKGDYKFTDEFPMAEGFNENVEFFELNPDPASERFCWLVGT